jgi:hypothetical protein
MIRRLIAGGAVALLSFTVVAGTAFAHYPTPTGIEGCTPGFWKNNVIAWESTAPNVYSPNATLGLVFPGTPAGLANYTLLQALDFPGNTGTDAKLLKHATAALLNTVHFDVDYQIGNENVLKFVVWLTLTLGTADQKNELKDRLDGWNNGSGGCPLRANFDY